MLHSTALRNRSRKFRRTSSQPAPKPLPSTMSFSCPKANCFGRLPTASTFPCRRLFNLRIISLCAGHCLSRDFSFLELCLPIGAMPIIGTVDSLWRYPVKSMRGEEMEEIFVGYAGVYGDRLFAFVSDGNPKGFPYFTGRDQRQMIRYRARFRNPEKAARPVNLTEAEKLGSGV